jgi:hypothetical protein
MGCRTTEENANLERLRADYKGAFDEWALQVSLFLVAITSSPDSRVVREAEERVAVAESAYRETRNRLTDSMLVPSAETTRTRD